MTEAILTFIFVWTLARGAIIAGYLGNWHTHWRLPGERVWSLKEEWAKIGEAIP